MSTALVIGAMKAGTTTLYQDLALVPGVHRGPKESLILSRGREGIVPDPAAAVTVDVCAEYTMGDRYPETASNAAREHGTDIPILYLLRDPVERAESHLRHLTSLGESVDPEALDEDHHVVRTSCYGWQVQKWLDAGHRGLHLLDFHWYSRHRRDGIRHVADLLGQPVGDLPSEGDFEVENSSENLRSARGGIRRVVRSNLYQQHVRSRVPAGLRARLKDSSLTVAADTDIALPEHVRGRLVDIFRTDLQHLRQAVPDVPDWAQDGGLR